MPAGSDAPVPGPQAGPGASSHSSLSSTEVAQALVALGCPPEKSEEMARQLLRRADQLSQERGWTHDQALTHLLRLMAGGWAAQARGIQVPPP